MQWSFYASTRSDTVRTGSNSFIYAAIGVASVVTLRKTNPQVLCYICTRNNISIEKGLPSVCMVIRYVGLFQSTNSVHKAEHKNTISTISNNCPHCVFVLWLSSVYISSGWWFFKNSTYNCIEEVICLSTLY